MTERCPRALCVDDDRDTVGLIAEELTDRGFDVRVACDGRGRVPGDPGASGRPVLADMRMPVLSGVEHWSG
jgi:CheY-like chemotaxis protein